MKGSVRWNAMLVAAGGVALLTVATTPVLAQTATGTIAGTVTDASTHQPLPGAQIFTSGGRFGAVANEKGEYRITNVPAGPAVVQTRLIGYGPVSKNVAVTEGQTATVDFALKQSAVTLSDVVVTGTGGAMQEKKLGNTVAKVDVTALRNAPVENPSEVLQGRVPGVSMLPSGGLTGEGARIRIRGNASLSQSNEPIIYVDGIRVDNGGGFGRDVGTGGGGSPSRLDDIDPSSIDHIEILKGAAAATLFGTEASNGVIQIFTKKGTAGAPRWSFNAERSAITFPDRIHPNAGFAGCHSVTIDVGGAKVPCASTNYAQVQADSLSMMYGTTITPYKVFTEKFANRLFETGYNNTLSGSVSGGATRVNYYVGGRYAYEDGPFSGKEFHGLAKDVNRRYQGTVNLDIFPRDNLHFNLRTFYSDNHQDTPGNNNYIYAPFTLAMFGKPEAAYCLDDNGNPSFQNIAGPDRCKAGGNPLGATAFGTVGEGLQERIYQDANHFNGALTATWTASPTLTFDATIGLDRDDARSVDYLPFGNNIDNFSENAPDGYKALDINIEQNITLDTKGSWNYQISKKFSSAFVAGAQGFINDRKDEGGSNQNFPGPGLDVLGAGNQPSVDEFLQKNVNAGFFAQEQVGYNNWVFVTGGARYDYNSAFGQSAGGVLYPKASISIVPSDLGSWHSSLLSTLRLRAAIGRAGRQPGAFDKFTTYTSLPSQFGGGLVTANLGNQDLKPEVSTEIEGGVELGLFSNKASVSATYWHRTVNDALVQKQFPISGGFYRLQLANIGQLVAHGTELSVSTFLINRPNTSLDLFANGAYIWQQVASMGGAAPIKAGGSYPRYRNFVKEGYAPGVLLGAKVLAPCSSYPSAQGASLASQNLCLQPGELPYDLNGDGKPDTEAQVLAALGGPINPSNLNPMKANDACGFATSDPRYKDCGDVLSNYLGKPYPDWQGGFGGNLTVFKHFKVQTLFEYKAGNYTVTNLTDAFRNSNPVIGRNTIKAATVEATLMNPASTAEQRLAAAKEWLSLKALSPYDGLNQNGNGDFIRWRELSLTYTADPSLAARIGARDLSLTFGVRNLMLWTKYDGTDPEINELGLDRGGGIDNNYLDSVDAFGFPLARRFTLSLRLGF